MVNAHAAVDLRKRATEQGWITGNAGFVTAPAKPATMAAGSTLSGEEVLRLAEEQLDVAKRVIQEGSTRIRRFVTERPVEAHRADQLGAGLGGGLQRADAIVRPAEEAEHEARGAARRDQRHGTGLGRAERPSRLARPSAL